MRFGLSRILDCIKEEGMADNYTKVVLTMIAIFLGIIAFEYVPTKAAHADAIWNYVALELQGFGIVVARGNMVKRCVGIEDDLAEIRCSRWVNFHTNTKLAE